jgi:hypothetical protein
MNCVRQMSLLEIPIGFSAAMSCVLANRVILNVRKASREVEQSRDTDAEAVDRENHERIARIAIALNAAASKATSMGTGTGSAPDIGSETEISSQGWSLGTRTGPGTVEEGEDGEDGGPGTRSLTHIEMSQLRSMRAEL